MDPAVARRLWSRFEPYHAVTYFSPAARQAWTDAGVSGFWRGYFAGRAAAFGPVPAPVVTAAFHNFHPRMVERAIPDVWERITPAEAGRVRLQGAVAALDAILGRPLPAERELAPILRAAAGAATGEGRPVFAAHTALDWPDGDRATVWHACTLLREHRGDGHVAALVAVDVDGCEAQVLAAAAGCSPRAVTQPNRGWSDDEWDAAIARLAGRGLVASGTGTATTAGRELRARAEDATDRAALRPWATLGADVVARVEERLEVVVAPIRASGLIPEPSPIGLPPGRL
jgi:hypothetical protein